ncbi:MAG TPA: substrate-binding domain-containing protein [Phycisphaerae bacterium]|nr:substrate-binding domain-containing protein [Phycisphaerae bacterium]HRY69451.1 substrate-binding domain-containing protein [Phycisphaerae bacterium]HSA26318.1 substrate-binding domain-containing protein [Phycisphaerae bacterium]
MLPTRLLDRRTVLAACTAAALMTGCREQPQASSGGPVPTTQPASAKKEFAFALIAKSQSNPVFQAARTGAEDAARDLSARLGVNIKVLWQTPNEEDAQKQAEYVEQLVTQGVDAISISCSVADTATPAIDAAVKQGVPVMCFDSDAPQSRRFCFYGTDDVDAGRTIMSELIKELGPGKHTVAIPGGNQNALNIQKRIQGAKEEAQQHPDITVKGVYYSKEVPQDAAAKVEEVQTANPEIDGWAMVSAIALFTDALLKWEPGKVKIVAMDALPAQLPYVRKGVVARLFAQQTYQWGYRSIEILTDKVVLHKDPPSAIEYSPLLPVDKNNAEQFEQNWKKWLRP